MVTNCANILHQFGPQPDGSWSETYSDMASGQILLTQPIQPYRPTTTPAATVGVEKGWCEPPAVEQPAAVVAQPVTEQPAPLVTAEAVAGGDLAGGVIALGGAGLVFVGLMVAGLAISYRIKPDPALQLPGQRQQSPMLPPPAAVPMAAAGGYTTHLAPMPESPQYQGASPAPAMPGGQAANADWQAVFSRIVNQAEFPNLFIVGRQGTGKTTLVEYLLSLIPHRKIAIDPHAEAGQWGGCQVIGRGMDYGAIAEFLTDTLDDVKTRYQIRASRQGYQPEPVTIVAEEMTGWAGQVSGAKGFIKASLSDFRKAGYQLISVAHSDTNTARGGAAGTASMRANGEVRIELRAKGYAVVSIPGEDTIELRFPNLAQYTPTAPPVEPAAPVDDRRSQLDSLYQGQAASAPHEAFYGHQPQTNRVEAIRQQHQGNAALLWLLDYLQPKQGQEVARRALCKHPQAAKLGVSSQGAMGQLLGILTGAELLSWVNDDALFIEDWHMV